MRPWNELSRLCKQLHHKVYSEKEREVTPDSLEKLSRLLAHEDVSQSNEAILKMEGHALLCELRGNYRRAIEFRRREIALMEKLHEITKSDDPDVREFALQDRDKAAILERKMILERLLRAED